MSRDREIAPTPVSNPVGNALSIPEPPRGIQPNRAMLEAMANIAEIQKGMNPKKGKDSLEHLREAREGAMYGFDAGE